jgi:cytochrome c553
MQKMSIVAGLTVAIALSVTGVQHAQAQAAKSKALLSLEERGKYLVTICLCNDCHSPKVFTPKGPQIDTTKPLSGHPANSPMPTASADSVIGMTPDRWGAITNAHLTAWRGPWGTSFTMNLTPDKETGIGSWTEAMFIKALRTGKHMGKGRDILPPMPWEFIGKMTDRDLKSVFAYLRTLKPIANAIPDPIPPPGAEKK